MLYNLAISLYWAGVAVASLFSKKVRTMRRGQLRALSELGRKADPAARYVWFHAASLGEFEQGRPLIERLRELRPEVRILLTFFSPSGYEVRKDYKGADIVCYLPLDTPRNAHRLASTVNIESAYFIKYEFWYNYMHELNKRGIPLYSVSAIFRPGQLFFQPWGKEYRKVLYQVTRFYVQNDESLQLLSRIGLHNASIVGDTRFDRVLQIKAQAKSLPIVEAFRSAPSDGGADKDAETGAPQPVFVAGSSWLPDEEIFIPYFANHSDWKLIIAPHVISETHLAQIESLLGSRRTVRYTQASVETASKADCLIIDCYGLLSSVYQYGDISYIGGGFGAGIHNVLEAAVWGIPVLFGPKNAHFQEAQELKASAGGFDFASADEFAALCGRLLSDSRYRASAGAAAGKYVASRAGATEKILGQ